jgi:hypothetical protein
MNVEAPRGWIFAGPPGYAALPIRFASTSNYAQA